MIRIILNWQKSLHITNISEKLLNNKNNCKIINTGILEKSWAHVVSQNMDVLDWEKGLTVFLEVLIGICADNYKNALISMLKLLRLNLLRVIYSFP